MKKITMMLMIFTFILMGLFTGCSSDDDDDNGPTGPSIDPNDYEFYMVVSSTGSRGEYVLSVSSTSSTSIQSLELTINGATVSMVNYMNNWAGFTNMTENETYQVEMIMNDNDYSFSMTIPYTPVVNWPTTWNIAEDTSITWTLTSDAEYQEIYGTATDNVIWDDAYADLDPSDRAFTIPANWVDASLTEYNLLLMEMNFSFDNDLIINCFSSSEMEYSENKVLQKPDKKKIAYDLIMRVLNN